MKNLKRGTLGLSFLIALLCLCGCSQTVVVSQEHIEKIQGYCKLNGGIKSVRVISHINSNEGNYAFVKCKDSAEYTVGIGINSK